MHRERRSYAKLVILSLAAAIILYFSRPAYLYYISLDLPAHQRNCPPGSKDDPRLLERPGASGAVKIINFDDSGEFQSRCQYTDALYEINWDRIRHGEHDFNAVVRKDAVSRPKLIVLYIHGWHNNAREHTGDLPEFRKLMKKLAETNIDKQVTGIYLNWEANSDVPIWHYLDFWNKKAKADRIAQAGNVTKIIGAVSAIASNAPNGAQFITIGHSFGARILMASSLQGVLLATQKAHPGRPFGFYKRVEGPSQTTFLLNPAFEASLFTSLDAFQRSDESFIPSQQPVVVSISTSNDWATSYAFPIGQWLSWWAAKRDATTIGNYYPFQTHELARDITKKTCESKSGERGLAESFSADGTCLRRIEGEAFNPFISIRTSGDILNGHNGVWDEKFSKWLFGYVNALASQLPKKMPEDQQ